MLRYADTAIVFQEIPDEVTLAINITGCPCRCPGCHSKHLWSNTGNRLDADTVDSMLHGKEVSCVSLMGGDANPDEVNNLLMEIRTRHPHLHTAWWSGRTLLSSEVQLKNINYLKLGPYLAHLGPLSQPGTNQHLYKISENGELCDITSRLQRHAISTQS